MKYLVTSALPYANGPLHFGHLAGAYLPADIYTRHLRISGKEVVHISGSDEHGVAIMLNAKKVEKDYKSYVDDWHQDHKELFKSFNVDFDYFGQTSADYHEKEVISWFNEIHKKGFVVPKEMQQLQCQDCENHLPDRFVTGTCYECDYQEARGDECPNCGIIIDPVKLLNPTCEICQSKNVSEVTVTQYYLNLKKYHTEFRTWFEKQTHWRNTVWPFVDSLTKEGLMDRAISRDLDWGIDVPLAEAAGKKLYVWFDAPIGYVSNTKKWIEENNRNEDYIKDWWQNPDTKIVNFIGKDNIIFHCIIFPAMSMISGKVNATYDVPANQFLNLQGKQFSKSSGWYVDAKEALQKFGSDALRYYLISILPEHSDSSFTWEGFQAKVNNELANNIGNLINRSLKFWEKNWPDGIDSSQFKSFESNSLYQEVINVSKKHSELINQKEMKKALEEIMRLGHLSNEYFSNEAPWAQIKEDPKLAAQTIAHTGCLIVCIGTLLAPHLPNLSENILSHFGTISDDFKRRLYTGDLNVLFEIFNDSFKPTKTPKALVPKIPDEVIEKLQEDLVAIESRAK